MSFNNHIINFSLDRDTIKKLMSTKGAKLEKKNNTVELVLPDSRIKLDVDKKEPSTATYYNNKSSNLHFLGNTVIAKTTQVLTADKKLKTKEREKTRGVELLDIPSIPNTISPLSPIKPTKLKKPSTGTSNNIKNTKKLKSTSNIPSRGSVTPQNTPRPSSNNSLHSPPVEKLNDRVIQLLAIKPYQIATMAKLLDSTPWDIKKIVDDVGICIPDQSSQKKKYCLKPQLYRNIRIWDWPLYTNDEKAIVCGNAKEAYDILQLSSDAIERSNLIDPNHKLIQPPPGRVPITTERDRAIAAKKSTNKSLKKEEKKILDLKGKGKTTPSGFSYGTTASEPAAPTPSPITSTPKIKSIARNGHLKPSSSNKKVGSKALPQVSPPPTKRREVEMTPAVTHTASKRTKSSDFSHHLVVELSEISSQPIFDKYCAKFLLNQKEYQNTKMNFKSKYPHYIKALENTKPPTGSKRSYYDLKLEYHDMVKENYLKTEDETSWQEAESQLRDCNEKRRRLNFMWSSIEKNLDDHHYKLKM